MGSVDGDSAMASWQDEVDGAALYRPLADLESDPRLAEVHGRLAAAERRPAALWEERLGQGVNVPALRTDRRTRVPIAVDHRLGAQAVLSTLGDLERVDSSGYAQEPPTQMPGRSSRTRSCCDR